MNGSQERWISKAYGNPLLRDKIVNAGMITLYCDYSGFVDRSRYSVACCYVHDRFIGISAKRLRMDVDADSNYGELLAVLYSLEILDKWLSDIDNKPKIAVVYTDCSRIERILGKSESPRPHYARSRNEIIIALNRLRDNYPGVSVRVRYISKHKSNNELHRLAHNAAREAAME
ncbi:hypothetical protein [Cohnella lupini]|uniref:Uncharacterized protein n=1 Tax=Cohnella lupini TaxID=1294267 RepID=A0A3D9I5X1_9BACL|nr:hypothetical protein [Cohnella lupini]RED57164.1 hypothetical protein DFP95_11178 [Cohnella lupini]